MADITRNQFDETKLVRRKILQKGSIVTDADWNEQADVFERSLRRSLSCLVQHQSMRFGDGFKVEGTGASLAVTVRAGFGAFQFGDDQAVLLQRASDLEISGFAPWTEARTDYVYLKIQQVEISASDDANIVNPDIGEETCRDLRLVVSFHISQGAAPPAAPSGQAHITLATVTKSTGSTIDVGDVTSLLTDFYASFEVQDGEVTTAKIADDAVTGDKIADGAVEDVHMATAAAIAATKIAAFDSDGQLHQNHSPYNATFGRRFFVYGGNMAVEAEGIRIELSGGTDPYLSLEGVMVWCEGDYPGSGFFYHACGSAPVALDSLDVNSQYLVYITINEFNADTTGHAPGFKKIEAATAGLSKNQFALALIRTPNLMSDQDWTLFPTWANSGWVQVRRSSGVPAWPAPNGTVCFDPASGRLYVARNGGWGYLQTS